MPNAAPEGTPHTRSRGRSNLPRYALALFASVAAATGCAAVLGLDETTLRDGDGGVPEAGTTPADVEVPTEDAGEAGAADAPLSLSPASLLVRRNATAAFTVTLARTATTPATVTATLTDLPPGVTASTLTLGPGQTSGTITVTTGAFVALGATTVRVTTTSTPAIPGGTASLLVGGDPGTPDTTFDTDGIAADASKGQAATFYALAVQPDGKILAGGAAAGGGWLLRRFEANGAADPTFAAATATLPNDGEIRAVAVDAQNRIVCVGTSNVPNGGLPQITVARLLPSGARDASFSGNAVARAATLEAPSGSSGLTLAVEADGSVYAAGARVEDGGQSGIVLKLRGSDGARDPSWNAGKLRVVEQNRLVGVASDGAGTVTLGGTDTSSNVATYYLARLRADGGLDPGFGTSGTSTFAVSYRAQAFTRLPSGALVLVGDLQPTGGYTAGLATPLGASIFSRAPAIANGASFNAVAPVGNAGFVAAGHASGPNGEARVMRILVDGGADTSFSTGGAVILDPAGTANGFDLTLYATALQPDGRVLVAGNRTGAGAVVYRLWQ